MTLQTRATICVMFMWFKLENKYFFHHYLPFFNNVVYKNILKSQVLMTFF